ncbi:MAG: tetratricopeptide repeat protein [Kibdelosporangium sp.]
MLTRAVDSARLGRYEDAVASLDELGGRESDDPRVLDLLARMHAQRGEFADADSCWARALQLDPDQRSAVEGRRRIVAQQAKRFRPRVLPVAVTAVAAVAVLGVALPVTPSPPPAPPPPDLSALNAIADRQDQLARDLAAWQTSLREPAQRRDQLFAALSSPRFTAARRDDSVLVTFNEAVFTRDARLSAAGRSALAELGRLIKPFGMSVAVIGHGPTVELGFRRAQSAAAELTLPPGSVDLRSAGSTQLPYPAGNRRNNTVTVLIS